MKDITEQLNQLKTNPRAGWVSDDVRERSRAKLMEAIGEPRNEVAGSFAFFKWNILEIVSTRVAAGAAVFVLLLGGWTTVNAASTSLPGDTLYNVKRVTEVAQLKFASTETKALLHSTFAQRRVDEVVALQQSEDPEKVEQVQKTIDAFNKEISAAQDELRKLKDEDRSQTVAIASQIDASIDQLTETIDRAVKTDGASQETTDVRDVAQGAADSVVDVVVETHEEEASELSARELEAMFQDELNAIISRQAFDLGRLVVIQSAIAEQPELLEVIHLPTGLDVMEFSLTSATNQLGDARSFIAAGGYRAAFDILRDIRATLLGLEVELANAEIAIINGIAELEALAQEPEEEITEEETDVEEDVAAEGAQTSESS